MCRQLGYLNGQGTIRLNFGTLFPGTGRNWYRRTYPSDQKCVGECSLICFIGFPPLPSNWLEERKDVQHSSWRYMSI